MASSSSSGNRGPRLIVVSNRLPITIECVDREKGNKPGNYTFKKSPGGLVSAFSGLGMEFTWIGYPDFHPPPKDEKFLKDTLLSDYKSVPVWIEPKMLNGYYNGFSNSVLWPLFHYYPGDLPIKKDYWDAYQAANSLFADAIIAELQDGDLVWIQDYHLMLVPQMLRKRITKKNVKIGWFLHTSFPSSEEFRKLSVGKEILLGILHSDLVGFHKHDYAKHFNSCCTRILNLKATPQKVELDGRYAHIGAFPIGTDPQLYTKSLEDKKVIEHIRDHKKKFPGLKTIIGIDRLDYIKGIPQKLLAMETFLNERPEWVGKVVLVQIAVPTRESVKEYKDLHTSVDEIAKRINGKYANFDPIDLRHTRVDHEELVALYAVGDVCLVTSTRDGMNLVSFEYIASQQKNHGVLVLSQFAGAAESLDGCLVVNPWNERETVDAIHNALTMSPETRRVNHNKLWNYVKVNTAALWGKKFVEELKTEREPTLIAPLSVDIVVEAFKKSSKKKVILLNYDEMLTAIPSKEVLKELKALTSKRDTYVYLLSGHSRDHLKTLPDTTGVGLSAEYGCFYKHPSSIVVKTFTTGREDGGWRRLVEEVNPSWKNAILPIFKRYTEQTPGSSIENKEINLAWEYRKVDQAFSKKQVPELRAELGKLSNFTTLAIVPSDKSLELRPASIDKSINKSTAVSAILKDLNATSDVDFILCVGNEMTDEVVFANLNKIQQGHVFTSTVGIFSPAEQKKTEAKGYLANFEAVRKLMSTLKK